VSVVTPVYNGAQFLAECIEGVLKQSYNDWEYIIHDNVSTDESAHIAEQYAAADPRIRVIRAPDFVGIWRNHNRALRLISPETRYCKIVHADDLLYPECLERMVAVADAHPSVGLVSAYRLVGKDLDGGGVFDLKESTAPGRAVIRRYFFDHRPVTGSPSTLLFRADVIRNSGSFFDEDFWHGDADAANRVLMDWDCGFVHQVLTFTRLHPAAQTTRSCRINTYLPSDGRVLLRYGRLTLAEPDYRRLVRRFLRQYAWFLVKQTLRPWRYADSDYQQFHLHEIDCMVADAAQDRETCLLLNGLRHLLLGAAPGTPPRPDSPRSPGVSDPGAAVSHLEAAHVDEVEVP
jgi:glycosyltransferase involved in cell wall biosynthesis